MTFATPWAFLLLLLLPVIIYRYFSRTALGLRSGNVLFPAAQQATAAGSSRRSRLVHLPFILRLLTLILLIIALARPLEGMEKFRDISKGVAMNATRRRC